MLHPEMLITAVFSACSAKGHIVILIILAHDDCEVNNVESTNLFAAVTIVGPYKYTDDHRCRQSRTISSSYFVVLAGRLVVLAFLASIAALRQS